MFRWLFQEAIVSDEEELRKKEKSIWDMLLRQLGWTGAWESLELSGKHMECLAELSNWGWTTAFLCWLSCLWYIYFTNLYMTTKRDLVWSRWGTGNIWKIKAHVYLSTIDVTRIRSKEDAWQDVSYILTYAFVSFSDKPLIKTVFKPSRTQCYVLIPIFPVYTFQFGNPDYKVGTFSCFVCQNCK